MECTSHERQSKCCFEKPKPWSILVPLFSGSAVGRVPKEVDANKLTKLFHRSLLRLTGLLQRSTAVTLPHGAGAPGPFSPPLEGFDVCVFQPRHCGDAPGEPIFADLPPGRCSRVCCLTIPQYSTGVSPPPGALDLCEKQEKWSTTSCTNHQKAPTFRGLPLSLQRNDPTNDVVVAQNHQSARAR